jgi:hypothetical protein
LEGGGEGYHYQTDIYVQTYCFVERIHNGTLHNETLQNDTLHNDTYIKVHYKTVLYKTIVLTKRYVLQNDTCYKTVGTCYKTVC